MWQNLLHSILNRNDYKSFSQTFFGATLVRAAELDSERKAGRCRGPLHDVPIALKDLSDINTSACGDDPLIRVKPLVRMSKSASMPG